MSGEIVEVACDCCDRVYRISRANMTRISRAISLRYLPGQAVTFNFSQVPDDVDLTEDLAPSTVTRVVRAAVRAASEH